MLVLEFTPVCPTKRCFHREDVRNVQFSVESYPTGTFFGTTQGEPTLLEVEVVTDLGQNVREDSG